MTAPAVARSDSRVSTRAGSRGSPRCDDASSRTTCMHGFQLARAPEGARDITLGIRVYPIRCVSTRAGSRGSPRFAWRIAGSRASCFNSRGLPREPAILPSVSAHRREPVVFQLARAPEGARDDVQSFGTRCLRADRFQLARAPEGARDVGPCARCERERRFQLARAPEGARDGQSPQRGSGRGFQLARAPEGARDIRGRIVAEACRVVSTRAGSRGSPRSHPAPNQSARMEVSTRAGSRGSPRWILDGAPRHRGVSTRAGSRGSPR